MLSSMQRRPAESCFVYFGSVNYRDSRLNLFLSETCCHRVSGIMPDFSVAMDKVFKGRHSDHSASPSCVYWLPAYNLSLPDMERKRRMSFRRPTVKN
jgi:hypothetical protein